MPNPLPRRRFLAAALFALGSTAACARPEQDQQLTPPRTPSPTSTPQPTSTQPSGSVSSTPATSTSVTTEASISMPSPDTYAGEVPTSFGTHLPGIEETLPTVPGERTIALTFDACGGAYDEALIAVLREFEVPATLFLAQPWIDAHENVARELAADGLFQIENHGTRHVPLSVNGHAAYGIRGTASPAEAIKEIEGNAQRLAELGVRSTWFRSGTAHYDDVAVRIARDGGMRIAGFTVNGDRGATASAGEVASLIEHSEDGAIVLAHMNHPHSGTAAGVRLALEQLRDSDVRFVPLQ